MTDVAGAWSLQSQPARDDARRWSVLRDGAPLSQAAWMAALGHDPTARAALTAALQALPFAAFLWETPPLPGDGDGPSAELVAIDSDALARARADASAFADAFAASDGDVATFANLGGDSLLVAPRPERAPGAAHLAAFLRGAAPGVVDALWIAVAAAVASWRAERRGDLWVSTSGLAVPWLHVRLDGVPKYYAHRPYAQPPR